MAKNESGPSLFALTPGGWIPADSTAERDQAIKQVEQHAEADVPDFIERACAFVVGYLRDHGPTPGEIITAACVDAGISPSELRAFGPVYQRLSRQKVIVVTGTCQRRRGHMTAGGNVWGLAAGQ